VKAVEEETVAFTGDPYVEELECENPLMSDNDELNEMDAPLSE
jgi:hypothetical protein